MMPGGANCPLLWAKVRLLCLGTSSLLELGLESVDGHSHTLGKELMLASPNTSLLLDCIPGGATGIPEVKRINPEISRPSGCQG